MKKKILLRFLIPFLLVTVISLLGIFSPVMTDIDYKLYDAALQVKPLAPISGKFLKVEIDDGTLDKLNIYPVKRSTLADGMMVLKELGAETILMDTQMVDPSPQGINRVKMNQIPDTISQTQNNTLSLTRQIVNAYVNGQLGRGSDAIAESEEYLSYLEQEYSDIFENLLSETIQIALNFDEYIANNFSFMNNVYVTNDFETDNEVEPEFIEFLKKTQSLKNIVLHNDPFFEKLGYNPTISPIMRSTLGSGFVETHQDHDGKIRVTDLIYRREGLYYPQLAFRYYLDRVGNPEINVYRNKIVLKGIKKGNKEPYDLKIPTNSDGSMAINWAGRDYDTTFERVQFYALYLHDEGILSLIRTIRKVISSPITSRFATDYISVLNIYNEAEEVKKKGDPKEFGKYIELRKNFLEQVGVLLHGTPEIPSLDKQYKQAVEDQINQYEFSQEELDLLNSNIEELTKLFNNGRITHTDLMENRKALREIVGGSTVTLGYTATSAFDMGPNPFEAEYKNMGMYPTLANNLLSEEFIALTPKWISVLLAFIFVFLGARIIKNREAKPAIILGSGLFIMIIGLYLGIFMITGYYIYILIPGLSFILSFIQMISDKLITTSKDKAFIKNAFGQYLSEDVIKEIIDDPSKLQLGGEKANITAFFTDIKGFSTLSETMTPDEIVSLLNEYLTAMSDIALKYKGTIDKYEGDAIIAFFGAPTRFSDHPSKAVLAAIKMKEREKALNRKFITEGKTVHPIETRIGINSGSCVVGNMGTHKKMDYTMMGNDVNIASRLEGVNKQYGTWIMASERTIKETGDMFLSRKLDRVRVVGINEPIRLYNPIAIKSEASPEQIQMVEVFEDALNLFEEKKWQEAKDKFTEVLDLEHNDKPSKRYVQLCNKFIKKEPDSDWDGVFNLTSK